ncbi:MAG: hypothetical protein A3H29_10325 [Acidobacteria bacterium RIFCSPLOWO2_02_FULL_67_21]|nr:MAG: hypothetical protein A3H29_10325 [Acidobacteria bacterium RIFCSPLOWO2_02_FULL_67_21]
MLHRILGIVGWIGTALVFGAVAIRFIRPEWDQYGTWAAWAGLALVVLYTLGQWREILGFFKHRQARYGALATTGVLVALGIVVAVNYLAARENRRWDLTANRQNSLSEQTIRVLQGLTAPVKFTVFDRQTDFDRFRSRLDEYAYHSGQVAAEYIDPDTRPVVAKEYEVQSYGTVVVEYMGRRERVTTDTEQDLTNAVIKVLSDRERKVYFVQGHGEKDPDRAERDGYNALTGMLRRDNYVVERLVLAQQKDVPEDGTVLVIAGPTSDLLPQELDALRRYLGRNGKLMVLVDPSVGGQPPAQLPNLEALLREWAITLGNNVVVDVSGATSEPSIAVAASYPSHAITERFDTLTIYPVARTIEPIAGGAGGRTAQAIVETSRASWAESNFASLAAGVSMDEKTGDTPGPLSVGVAVAASADAAAAEPPEPGQPPRPETRVVVFGDSDFATNAYGGVPGNLDFFANSINWLAQQENLIAIRPKEPEDRRVTMTQRQQTMVFLTSILILPAFVFATGVYTWWRRR